MAAIFATPLNPPVNGGIQGYLNFLNSKSDLQRRSVACMRNRDGYATRLKLAGIL